MTPPAPAAAHPAHPAHGSAAQLERITHEWGGRDDLWVFGYASLIWRPDFEPAERLPARVHGWHRALKMWSRINRGTPEQPGLVFALLRGGSCAGLVLRVHRREAPTVLPALWAREMPGAGVYEPRWLGCHTPRGRIRALGFTLPAHSPSHTGELSPEQLRHIFAHARGRYGTTLDYARATLEALRAHGIEDRALERLLRHAPPAG